MSKNQTTKKDIQDKLNLFKELNTIIYVYKVDFNDQLLLSLNKLFLEHINSVDLSDNDEKLVISFIEILTEHYEIIRDTYLDYTVQSQSELTSLLCDIAEFAAYVKLGENASEEEIAEKALNYLMPGVKYRYQNPSDLGLTVESPSDYLDLKTILKTHLLVSGDNELFLEPVWSNLVPNNKYFLNSSSILEYTSEYLKRVAQHSEHTQALQIIRDQKKSIESDTQTLLGQLNLLIHHLNFNSKDGIGNEEVAGSQGELAIHNFLEYQKLVQDQINQLNIPELNYELKLLRQMVGKYEENETKIDEIDTCFATRRDSIKNIILTYHQKLSKVSVSKETQEELLKSLNEDYATRAKDFLSKFKQTNGHNIEYHGTDSLVLTSSVLRSLQIEIKPKNFEEVNHILTQLTLDSLQELSLEKEFINNLLTPIERIEDAVTLCITISKDKLSIILPKLLNKFLNKDDLRCFLMPITNPDKLNLIFDNLKVKIKSIKNLSYYLDGLNNEQVDHIIKNNHLFINTLLEKNTVINNIRAALSIPKLLAITCVSIPESDRLAVVKKENNDGDTVLHLVVDDPQSLGMVLDLYPEPDRLAAVKKKNRFGNTILHLVANNPQSLGMVLDKLPESDRLAAVKEEDSYGDTVLHLIADNPQSLGIVLDLYPEPDRLAAVKEEDRYGDTVLHLVVDDPQSLGMVLDLYPEPDRLAAVKKKNRLGNTILHLVANNPQSLGMVLDKLPESDRLAAVKEEDSYGDTVLHLIADNPQSLGIVLDLYPEPDRLAAVKKENNNGDTVLDLVVDDPQSLGMVLDKLPESDRLAAVKEEDSYGDTVLHLVVDDPQSLGMVLDKLPESDRLAAVKKKNRLGNTVLHLVVDDPQSLGMVLDKLPESDRLAAVKEEDSDGDTVLHLIADNPQSLGMVLDLYPAPDRLAAVKEEDSYGDTVLHLVVDDPQSLGMVLDKLPESDRLAAVKEEDSYGDTVLHLIADNPQSLGMVLDKLPESDRLAAVKKENNNGDTVLDLVVDNHQSLGMVLDKLPESDRLAAVKEKDRYGHTMLYLAADIPQSLDMITNKVPQLNSQKDPLYIFANQGTEETDPSCGCSVM